MKETQSQFEKRKSEHISLSLGDGAQALTSTDFDRYELIHEALPEIDFKEVDVSTSFFSLSLSSPLFISSMTAGHDEGELINTRLAALSERKKILMGVGSQRKELDHAEAGLEWKRIRKQHPGAELLGNVGLAQVISSPIDQIRRLVDSLEARALIVHTNPLQEALQEEGTPHFRGGLRALTNLVQKLGVPVILKEVGFGFSNATLQRLNETGIFAVDVSGKGGTHWGRIEGLRACQTTRDEASLSFSHWGRSALRTLQEAQDLSLQFQLWASGGVRSGVDAAKCLSLGARMVGLAQPWLKAALVSEEKLDQLFEKLQLELKVALFCTGSANVAALRGEGAGNEPSLNGTRHLPSRKVGTWVKS
jgi:isopentenyl-diphosphate delta-isomerase